MLCRLPFPIAVCVVIKCWPCCLITGLCCLVTWTKSKAYQRLLSQMLKSVFLKHPEDRNHLVPWVHAAPEVVFRESIYQRCQSRELRTCSTVFFLHADLETHTSLENVQLDLVWSVLLRKVWPEIFLTRRLSLDSNNMLLLLDVGFGFGFGGFFPCFLVTCVSKSST